MQVAVDVVTRIKKVADQYKHDYSESRLRGILEVVDGLTFQQIDDLCGEVENRFRTLPLRDDFVAIRNSMGIKIPKKTFFADCKWCGNEGMVFALRLRDKQELVFKCTCAAGRELSDSFLIWDDEKCEGKFRKLKHGEAAHDKV